MKIGRLVTLSRPRKVWKASLECSICHQWFNMNWMNWWEHFFCTKKTKTTTLFINSSPLVQCSAILEKIRWTQAANAVLCQPHHTDTSYAFVYALIWTKIVFSVCGWHRTAYAACVQREYSPKWRYGRWREETNCWIKSLFLFSLCRKSVPWQ